MAVSLSIRPEAQLAEVEDPPERWRLQFLRVPRVKSCGCTLLFQSGQASAPAAAAALGDKALYFQALNVGSQEPYGLWVLCF